MKIALTYIIKDDSEAAMFERSLQSFSQEFDGLFVAVTGSSGKHQKIIELTEKYNGIAYSTNPQSHPQIYHNGKFAHFAEARNFIFNQVPDDFDWISWADVDDVLAGGEQLRDVAEHLLKQDYDRVFFTYFYAVKLAENGAIKEVEVEHLRERLIKPRRFKWVSRLHETLVPIEDGFQPKDVMFGFDLKQQQEIAWVHLTENERLGQNMQRNIEILELQAEEEEYKDPRTLFYLAKCYYEDENKPEYPKAEELLRKYLELSGWKEERANAWQYLGHIAARKGDKLGAINAYHRAIQEYPVHHTSYLRLANAYFELNEVEVARHWLDVASKMPAPKARTTIGNPYEAKILLAALRFHEAQILNDMEGMVHWAQVRQDLMGSDDGLLSDVLANRDLNLAANGVLRFAKWLKNAGYADKVGKLLESVPPEMSQFPFVGMIATEVAEPKIWQDNEIAYFASFGGAHFEKWGPSSLKTGIGGSETAVIELAKEWVKLGYKVTVYCDTNEVGEHEGVVYKPYFTMNWKDHFNVLILWRSPHLVDRVEHARKLLLDLHDVPAGVMYTPERLAKLDKILVKSEFHRRLLPAISDEKFVVISNGIRA